VREYAALFDTVYVSMYKYFNAGSGAILAGPKNLLENLFHARRMFGNGLCQLGPFAAVGLHFFDGSPRAIPRRSPPPRKSSPLCQPTLALK
jgi:threonine aldolase